MIRTFTRIHAGAAAIAIAVLIGAPAAAQAPAEQSPAAEPAAAQPAPAQPAAAQPAGSTVHLTTNHSTVLRTDFDIKRIAVTNPEIANGTVVSPREVLVDGRGPGSVSLIVWGDTAQRQFDVVVAPAVSPLQQRLQELFPGQDIHVSMTDDAITLSGHVQSNDISLRAAEIAQATSAKAHVINLLQLPGGQRSEQVMLQVRFAEVNRHALQELGSSFFTGTTGYGDYLWRSTTQQFAAPAIDNSSNGAVSSLTFSDFLNLFLFNKKYDIGAVIRALKQEGYFQSLAEPNLMAYNGKEASFLAGGEIPVPVVQGITNAVTIQYKEFGIRLHFTPTIAGDTIRLKVAPEVSSLDFNNGITLSGFRIPALMTRRAETEVELRDGQSFAIAGLLDNVAQSDTAAIPILSKIPIIGYLFQSKAERKDRTELMVLITPHLVRPLNPDEVPALPKLPGTFLPPTGTGNGPNDGAGSGTGVGTGSNTGMGSGVALPNGTGVGSAPAVKHDGTGAELRGGGGLMDAPPVEKPDVRSKP